MNRTRGQKHLAGAAHLVIAAALPVTQADSAASFEKQARDMGGGFDAYRANSFTYNTVVTSGEGPMRRVEYREVTETARAYHSSYFELLGEQGYFGLAIWLLLQGLGVWHMESLRRRFRRRRHAAALVQRITGPAGPGGPR